MTPICMMRGSSLKNILRSNWTTWRSVRATAVLLWCQEYQLIIWETRWQRKKEHSFVRWFLWRSWKWKVIFTSPSAESVMKLNIKTLIKKIPWNAHLSSQLLRKSLSSKSVSQLMIRRFNQRLWRRKKPSRSMTTKSQRDLWLLLAQVRSSSRRWSCSSEICCLEQVVCWSWRLSKRLSLVEAHLCMFSQAPSFQTTQNIWNRVYQHLVVKSKLLKTSKLIQAMKLESTPNQKLVTLAPQKTTHSNGLPKEKTKF